MKKLRPGRAAGWLLDLLFPVKCPFCGAILEKGEELICSTCQRELPWLEGSLAERTVDFAESCWSPLAYRERVREGIRRYKFHGVRASAKPFGSLMSQCVLDHSRGQLDGVTWAPLSRKRLRERGYDQARLLAEQVGERLELPVIPTLRKVRHSGPQSHLKDEAARRANALGAYELLPGAETEGRRLLLVDDVVTSGATLSECARLLRMGGAEVYCLTLAQAHPDDHKKA